MHLCSLKLHVVEIIFTLHDDVKVSLIKDLASEHRALLVTIAMKLGSPNLIFVRIVINNSPTTYTSQYHVRTITCIAKLFDNASKIRGNPSRNAHKENKNSKEKSAATNK